MDLDVQVADGKVAVVENGMLLWTGVVQGNQLQVTVDPKLEFVQEVYFVADSAEQLRTRLNIALEGIKQAVKFYGKSSTPKEHMTEYLNLLKKRGYIAGYLA